MDLGLDGKRAIVTGGSKGIGLRIAAALLQEGCAVTICGRDAKTLESAVQQLQVGGGRVFGCQADLLERYDASALVTSACRSIGGVDILVNNVGRPSSGRLLDTTLEEWRKTFDANLFQAVQMIQLVAPHMRQAGGGAVINVASISGWRPPLSDSWQYGSSKAALIYATEPLALELVHDNVRVNTVSPGSTLWPDGGWDRYRLRAPEQFDMYVSDGFPMGRLGSAEEVASVVVFLASPASGWINGRNIPVDGLEQPVFVRERRAW